MIKKIIFDCGANEGDNLNYYLQKKAIVVAIEADPNLTKIINKKYKKYIDSKRLFVENICLSNKKKKINFFINKKSSRHSTAFPNIINNYEKVTISADKLSNIVKKYFNKFNNLKIEYIKIDIEGSDHIVLEDLITNKIYPNYISLEVANTRTLDLIIQSKYKSFKFVNGYNEMLRRKKNSFFTSFSAGPYGNDILGKYYKKDSVLPYFFNNRFNWVDLHCKLQRSKFYEQNILLDRYFISTFGFKFYLKKLLLALVGYVQLFIQLRLIK
jgi:FkbM family methyltransferase